jgi:hypothetical protein
VRSRTREKNRSIVQHFSGGVTDGCTFEVLEGDEHPRHKEGADVVTVGRGWLKRNGIPAEDLR